MIKYKAVALSSLVGAAIALAPVSSAFADQRFHGGHAHVRYAGHGGYGYQGHGHGGYGWPLFGLAAAVVGTAAAIVTAPVAILAAAAEA
ncbi:MAG TPA: hypothetical protein VII36_09220, partial [Usitatibacter sp.]